MKNIFISCLSIFLSFSMFVFSQGTIIYAHESILSVEYDDCQPPKDINGDVLVNSDGADEMWYYTRRPVIDFLGIVIDGEYHLDHDVQTIKYYFEPTSFLSSYTWTTDIYREYIKTMPHEEALINSEVMALKIKEAYADSMKKWNNIYYYSYDAFGNRITHKVINIVEGTESDHNLSIYPIDNYSAQNECPIELWRNTGYYACCGVADFPNSIPTWEEGMVHAHYDDWFMYVNVNYYYEHGEILGSSPEYDVGEVGTYEVQSVRERTGMHEVGHILGLGDIDSICNAITETDEMGNEISVLHHSELLMGYEYPASNDATYKDIAGVSITRGFHTDDDHRWMIRTRDDGSQYLICSLCNGVRNEFELTNGAYEGQTPVVYGSCNNEHSLTGGNMLFVATDGTIDFYKCLKCRHIEEITHVHTVNTWTTNSIEHSGTCTVCFQSLEGYHNWECSSINSESHMSICADCNIYDIDPHSFECTYIDGDTHTAVCRYCGYTEVQSHAYEYKAVNASYHKLTCSCGATTGSNMSHIWTTSSLTGYVECKMCHQLKFIGDENIPIIKEIPPIIDEETE